MRLKLGRGVPGIEALGAEHPADLLEPVGRLIGWGRSEQIDDGSGDSLLRFPLPGTPDATGRVHEAPRGAGTGHAFLRIYRRGHWESLRARFTHPRSTSPAEREWNLACYLRSSGVGTPELLAVGSVDGGLYSRRCFLVTRELDGMVPLSRWLRENVNPEARELGLEALRLALLKFTASGMGLPALRAHDVYISYRVSDPTGAADTHEADCAAKAIGALVEESQLRSKGTIKRMPSIVVANLQNGRILAPGAMASNAALEDLRNDMADALSDTEQGLLFEASAPKASEVSR